MRVRTSLKWLFAFGIVAAAAPQAGAQPAPGTTPAATAGDTTAGQGAEQPAAGEGQGQTQGQTQGQVGFQRKTQLTPQEELAESQKHIARMEMASRGVRKMLANARRERDVVKTLCLNDKLSQVDVAVRSARDRRDQLEAAVKRNDAELANHEFTILTVLRQRVEQIVAEANECLGAEAAFVGETKVTTKVDETIPPEEAQYPPPDESIVVQPPQCTSCSL